MEIDFVYEFSCRFKSRHVTSLIRVSILDSKSGVTIISSSRYNFNQPFGIFYNQAFPTLF